MWFDWVAGSGHGNAAISDSIWTTALVVAFLESKHSEQKDEWELLVMKAHQWLTGQAELVQQDANKTREMCEWLLDTAKQAVQKECAAST